MAAVDFSRFASVLNDLGVAGAVRVLPDSASTAAAAAAQLGCEVGAIANSLVFAADGEPLLVMTSGAHRVDTALVASLVGAAVVSRADARSVRAWTGQVIGGVGPVGHPAPIRTAVDVWLAKYDVVGAAASASPLAPDGPWKDLATLRAPVRLGAEVFLSGRLAPASVGQACTALREFRQEMDRWKVDAYRAIATSAVREAKNGGTLVERARREAGIELETIEGIEEARLIQLAVTRRIALGDRRALLIDVGGGSTELTLLERGDTVFTMSLPLGTVRMLEAYLKGAKTVDRARERLLEEAINRALGEAVPQLGGVDILIGTGGNVDTLCDLCPAKGTPRGIDVAAAKIVFKKMCAMSNGERRDAYQLRPDRADTIVPAAAIFLRLASVLKATTILSQGVGLAAGVLE
ncbi:MAG TPA: YbaK/EbsC family protein, partial [Gemmatimonadales bacterium]|nr:YbaK/EbsC family protein [Gemmatimonadales bacterium]